MPTKIHACDGGQHHSSVWACTTSWCQRPFSLNLNLNLLSKMPRLSRTTMLTKDTLLTIHLLCFNPCRSVRRSRPIFYHLYCSCINHPSSGVDSPGYTRFGWHKCKDNDDKGLFQVLWVLGTLYYVASSIFSPYA